MSFENNIKNIFNSTLFKYNKYMAKVTEKAIKIEEKMQQISELNAGKNKFNDDLQK